MKSLKEQEQSPVHQKPEIRFAGGTPEEAANAQVFGLYIRKRKGFRAVITLTGNSGRGAEELEMKIFHFAE